MGPGWWAPNLNEWFDKRRQDLREGSAQPMIASDWLKKVNGTKRTKRLMQGLEEIANHVVKDAGL